MISATVFWEKKNIFIHKWKIHKVFSNSSLASYSFSCMFSTGLQSIVNAELARWIAASSLHGMSWRYIVKSVWVTGSTPFMEAVRPSSESWVNTKTGLLTAHLHDDIQNFTFLQRERERVIEKTAASATDFLCCHFVSQNGATDQCCFNYRKFCCTFCTTLPKDSQLLLIHFLKSTYYTNIQQRGNEELDFQMFC